MCALPPRAERIRCCVSYGEYEGDLRKLIHIFKYSGVMPMVSKLGPLLNAALPREQQFDVIVPMPLHWRKRLERGFNQSELLAKFRFETKRHYVFRMRFGRESEPIPSRAYTRPEANQCRRGV